MYSALCGIAPTISLFIIQLFTIQKPIVLSFTIQKSSWQGILLYSTLYTSAPAIQQFTIQLFTIQEWTSFTPGRVVLCIAPCILVLQLFHYLLYHYLLYKGYHKILLAGLYYCIVPYVVLPQPLSSLLYHYLLYRNGLVLLLAGLYYV